MIPLNGTSDILQAFLAGAVAANEPTFVVTYADIDDTTRAMSPDNATGVLNGATDVDLIAGVAGSSRMVKMISICNLDTSPVVVTVQIENGADRPLIDAHSLAAGKTLVFLPEIGWAEQPA